MKHEHLANDKDRAELAQGDSLIADGRLLKRRVYGRLRQRAWLASKKDQAT